MAKDRGGLLKAARKPALFSEKDNKRYRQKLLAWYEKNRRDLPWRESRDPYRIWLSEIMLQQTRVAAVIGHYHEFLRRFPTVEKLAAARESSVLAAWSGLGYYRRARMLHAAAKVVVREHGGKFPVTAEALRRLPGIGRYTAAAIASIAYGEPVAVVDGNVERVLQRVRGQRLSAERLWAAAGDLLDPERPGDFNQAIMELGATVCKPRAPMCVACPIVELCATRGELDGAKKEPQQKQCEIHYVLQRHNGSVLLVQRQQDASLMPGMWELPQVDGSCKGNGTGPTNGEFLFTVRHSITVTNYTVRVWSSSHGVSGQWVGADRLGKLPLTGLAGKILRVAKVI